MSRKIILIKQELLLLVYELNRSGLLAENEKIRPILAQLEKLLLDRKSGSAGMPRPSSYAVFCLKKKTPRSGGENKPGVMLARPWNDLFVLDRRCLVICVVELFFDVSFGFV